MPGENLPWWIAVPLAIFLTIVYLRMVARDRRQKRHEARVAARQQWFAQQFPEVELNDQTPILKEVVYS